MPTRLDVLLQSRKSATAEPLHRPIAANASTGSRPVMIRAEREADGRESVAVMRRGYIKLLMISRGPAGSVNARELRFPRCGMQDRTSSLPVLRVDMAKSV